MHRNTLTCLLISTSQQSNNNCAQLLLIILLPYCVFSYKHLVIIALYAANNYNLSYTDQHLYNKAWLVGLYHKIRKLHNNLQTQRGLHAILAIIYSDFNKQCDLPVCYSFSATVHTRQELDATIMNTLLTYEN